jgi:hypothetical protein
VKIRQNFRDKFFYCRSTFAYIWYRYVHEKVNIAANTLNILSHIRLTLIISLCKRNRFLFCKPMLLAEYRTTVKSVGPVKPSLTKSTFCVWAHRGRIVNSLKV